MAMTASYLADAIEGHHDRFTGVFSVDVLAPDAVEKIKYWIGRGLSGLRLFAAGSTVSAGQGWSADPGDLARLEILQRQRHLRRHLHAPGGGFRTSSR